MKKRSRDRLREVKEFNSQNSNRIMSVNRKSESEQRCSQIKILGRYNMLRQASWSKTAYMQDYKTYCIGLQV